MATVTRLPVHPPCEVCGDPARCETVTGWKLCARHYAPPVTVLARTFEIPEATVRERALKLGLQDLNDAIDALCRGQYFDSLQKMQEAREHFRMVQR